MLEALTRRRGADADGALAFLGQCLKGDQSPTEGEIELEPWADRVLKSAPLWVGRIASKGGTRWTNTAAGCMTRACVPKDAAALRLWGCVSDEISDAETARAAAARRGAAAAASAATPALYGADGRARADQARRYLGATQLQQQVQSLPPAALHACAADGRAVADAVRLPGQRALGGNPISIIISALHKGYSLSVTTSIVLYKFTHFTKTSCSAFEISLCSIISTSDITWLSSSRLLLTQNVFLCFIASAISNKYLGSKTLNADSSVGKYIIPAPNIGNSTIIISVI